MAVERRSLHHDEPAASKYRTIHSAVAAAMRSSTAAAVLKQYGG
jgi:hypothetical protein